MNRFWSLEPPAPETEPGSAPLWAAILAFVAAAFAAMRFHGLAGDEEAAHFLIARHAPADPELFLNLTGRPLVTLALTLPSQIGLLTARMASGLAAGLTAFALTRLVVRAGWLAPLWTVGLLCLQPFYLAHAGTVMTEPWAAALLSWGLLAYVERRFLLLAAVAALLPLARFETLVLWPFVAGVLLKEREARRLWVLPLGLLAWNLAGAAGSGDPLWLLHQTDPRRYPVRSPLHYLESLVWVLGLGVFVPVVLGIGRAVGGGRPAGSSGRRLLSGALSAAAVLFATYTVLAAWIPITFGNLRYMATLAPFFTVLAAAGLHGLLRARGIGVWAALAAAGAGSVLLWNHEFQGDFATVQAMWWLPAAAVLLWAAVRAAPARIRILAPVLALALGAWSLGTGYRSTFHLVPRPEEEGVAYACALIDPAVFDHVQVYAAHPLLALNLGLNPYDRDLFPPITDRIVTEAPAGSILFWESHYVPRYGPALGIEALGNNESWTFLGGVADRDSSWVGGFLVKTRPITGAGDKALVSSLLESAVTTLTPRAWYALARSAEAGVGLARRVARADPTDPHNWRQLADRQSMAGDVDGALASLARAEELEPGAFENLWAKVPILHRAGRTAEALEAAEAAFRIRPPNPAMELRYGHILLDLGRTGEAVPHLVAAAARFPGMWNPHYLAGEALRREGEWDRAEPYFRHVLALFPTHAGAALGAAECVWRRGRTVEAERETRDLLAAHPSFGPAYALLADMLSGDGRGREAHNVLEAGLRATGGDPDLSRRLQEMDSGGN